MCSFTHKKIGVCSLLIALLAPVVNAIEDNVDSRIELESAQLANAFIDLFTIDQSASATRFAKEANTPYFMNCQVVNINWETLNSERPTIYFQFPVKNDHTLYAKNLELSQTATGFLWKGLIMSESGGTVRLYFDEKTRDIAGTIASYTENSWDFRRKAGRTLICQNDPRQPID